MRTYTHALLSYLAAARISDGRGAEWSSAGAAWLLLRRGRLVRDEFYGEVCGRRRFGAPDSVLHSAAVLAAAAGTLAATQLAAGLRGGRSGAFLLSWAGHAVADFLTHGADAPAAVASVAVALHEPRLLQGARLPWPRVHRDRTRGAGRARRSRGRMASEAALSRG